MSSGPQVASLTLLLILNGLRVSEAVGIDLEDLGTSAGYSVARIRRKGGGTATVPLAVATVNAARSAAGSRSTGPLFLNGSLRRLSRQEAHRMIRRLGRRCGLKRAIYPHLLRHTWVTLALDAGAALQDVQDAAGHRDPRTTRRYDRARGLMDRHPTFAVAGLILADPSRGQYPDEPGPGRSC